MKIILSLILLCLFRPAQAQTDEQVLENHLFNLPDVQFKKYVQPQQKHLKYILSIKQPLDHQHPEKGYFYQSAVLTHKGFDKPVVMETEGYEVRYGGNEIEKILDANNINIEHRYFGSSKPDSLQWDYLTISQVVSDLHRIRQLLGKMYHNKWVSTGISRGGQVSIFYRSVFPNDVVLTIPYVASLTNSLEDKRIYHFLDTVSTKECREKIFSVQKFLLQHQEEAINKMKWYAKGRKLTFDYFGGAGKAFEMAVLEYPFAFWQLSNLSCDKIPVNKSVDDYLEHIMAVGSVDYLSDDLINRWAANGYMARTEMGFYGYDITRFKKYLRFVKGENPTAAFVPKSIPVKTFDSSFLHQLSQWLEEKGNNMLYIYGSRDTWSACRVIVSDKTNAKSFLLPGANHFDARVKNMPKQMQQEFAEAVSKMLNMPVNLHALD